MDSIGVQNSDLASLGMTERRRFRRGLLRGMLRAEAFIHPISVGGSIMNGISGPI
jgi:hypothetical protein